MGSAKGRMRNSMPRTRARFAILARDNRQIRAKGENAMRTMELLAPAGGREQLEYAIHFGADAVYLATERYGMRKRADNFTESDLPDAIAYAHAHGARVHVTVNTVMTDADVDDLPRYFRFLEQAGADAVIVSDLGAISIARSVAPKLEIHLSTQASCENAASARAYYDLGVRRIVVAREMSLDAIAELRRRIPDDLAIEAFVHGAMCMAYSGRCLISDYLTGRGANVGHCTQPCRWKYALVEETRPGEYFPVVEDDRGSFIMSSHDMNMLAHLDELAAAGVNSVKIEGRAKGAYYVASVVNAYRHVLDGEPADAWEAELETTSHRPWCTGFYFGQPEQNKGSVEYARAYQMVACVEESGAVLCRNRFAVGDTVEVLSPGQPVRTFDIGDIVWHAKPEADLAEVQKKGTGVVLGPDPACVGGHLVRVQVANRTMESYSIEAPFPLRPRDILRAYRPEQDLGRTL